MSTDGTTETEWPEGEERLVPLLKPAELSEALWIPLDEVRRLTRKRKIPHYRLTSHTTCYRLDRVQDALAEQAEAGAAKLWEGPEGRGADRRAEKAQPSLTVLPPPVAEEQPTLQHPLTAARQRTPSEPMTPSETVRQPAGTRLAAAPSIWGGSMREWLETAGKALETGKVDAIFAPDHLRTRDREAPHTLAWAPLLAAAQQSHQATVGPLVARCGAGGDEHVIHTLETLADMGPTIANLGIGDRIGRQEHERAGLPWPDRNARIASLARTARRCLDAGLETYIASDKDDLHTHMPAGAGAHISQERSRQDHGESLGRHVAVAYWTGTDRNTFRSLAGRTYTWVSIEQLRGEPAELFVQRLTEAAEELGLWHHNRTQQPARTASEWPRQNSSASTSSPQSSQKVRSISVRPQNPSSASETNSTGTAPPWTGISSSTGQQTRTRSTPWSERQQPASP